MASRRLAQIISSFISLASCWASFPNCTFESCPVCLSDGEQKPLVMDGPDGQAYAAPFRIGRAAEYWDSQSIIANVLGILVSEKLGIAVQYVPAADETVAVLAMSNCENWMSGECEHIITDSISAKAAAEANNSASGSKLFEDPLPDMMFHSEVLGWAERESDYSSVDWTKTRLARVGTAGFLSNDLLYAFREMVEEAWNSTGIVLDYWKTYTTPLASSYFETPRQLMAAGVAAETLGCSSSDVLVQAGMDVHTELGYTCTQESWWLTPACAALGNNWTDECIPVLDDDWGYVKADLYKEMARSGMRLAKLTVGYDLHYELIFNFQHRTLFHWWDTDTMFLGRRPVIVNMPASLASAEPPSKVVYAPVLAASEQLKVLVSNLLIPNDKLDQMLQHAATAIDAELFDDNPQMFQKVACDWLRANPELVASWLPDSRACPPGQAYDESTSQCAICPTGTYSARNESTLLRECVLCPPGSFCLEGGTSPVLCPKGSYANASGQGECMRCLPPSYADALGSIDCKSCQLIIPGGTTLFAAATSEDDCTCPEQTYYRQDSGCTPCTEGLSCWGGLGSPKQAKGYYGKLLPEYGMDNQEWFQMFKCHADARRCPNAQLGVCSEGREGLACTNCKDGLTSHDDGTCAECAGNDPAFFALACLGVPAAVVGLYLLLDNDLVAKQPHTVLLVGIIGSMIMGVLQQLGTIASTSIEWVDPVSSMLDMLMVFSFEIEVLRVGCIASFSPLLLYVGKLCMALMMLGFMLLVHVAVVLLRHRGRFRDRAPTLIRSIGTLLLVFQIAIAGASIPPFECSTHPNRFTTVARYPTILCGWEDGGQEWQAMAMIGMFSTLLVCAWVAGCLAVIYQLPRQIEKNNEFYMRSFTFLFMRFKPDVYWFTVVPICRNLLVSLAPTLPDSTSQILCLQGFQLLYVVVVAHYSPWRVRLGNYLDITITMALLAFLSCAAFFVETSSMKAVAWLCSILVVFMFFLNATILGLAGFQLWSHKYRKPFSFFLCHHKAGAGAFARLLKLHLTELCSKSLRHRHQKVFIDSDDLKNLEFLFDYVGSQSEHIVVLMSEELLLRPWCMGELVTAHLHQPGLKMVPVRWSDFTRPDDEFISNYSSHVDCSCLLPHNITIQMIQSMLGWLRDLPGLSLPALLTGDAVDHISRNIVSGSFARIQDAEVSADPSKTASKGGQATGAAVVVIADTSNTESVSTALVLCKMVSPLTTQDPSLTPRYLEKDEDVAESVKTCIFILSNGAFFEASFVKSIIQAARIETMVLPIIAQDGFRFPGKEFLEDYKQRASSMLAPHGILEPPEILVQLISSLFKEIAIVFSPQDYSSTEELLKVKSRAVNDRLMMRQMTRLSPITLHGKEEGASDEMTEPPVIEKDEDANAELCLTPDESELVTELF
eukprot:TRINITY_DN5110_c0_g1_i4.p1 TRINITY_DN5110_c0_g1~~TRINITY_DN5110_c0_g1_i4.p1  ORF type:complete len:1421 (-),score=213.93 TRINITY_DN5110_c0_g1_i4:543-4754(-)